MNRLPLAYALWTLFAASLAMCVFGAATQLSVASQNALITQLSLEDSDISSQKLAHATPEVRLARALFLKKHHRYQEALATLSLIMQQGSPAFQATVRYNLGNIYLEQAIASVERMAVNDAMPLLMLAKQAYRQALALDSGFWDAKYNLEAAMRLLPEFDRIDPDQDRQDPKTAVWTSVPGFPRGLP